MKDKMKLIGKNIKQARKENTLTQEELSKIVNLDRMTLVNIENGNHFPSLPTLFSICEGLKISMAYLMGEIGEKYLTEDIEDNYSLSECDEFKSNEIRHDMSEKIILYIHAIRRKIESMEKELDIRNLKIDEIKIHIEVIEKLLIDKEKKQIN